MLVLNHAVLIDGAGGVPLPDATVVIDGGKIGAVGQNLPIPEHAQVIDLKGKTLLPGLIDAHSHLGGSARVDRPPHTGRFVSYDYAEHREAALAWGVTTLRSAGDFMPDIVQFRDEVNAGRHRSPRIVTAGRMIQAQGGHPGYSVLFEDPAIFQNELVFLTEESDPDAEVGKLAEAGVDWIKLVASGENVIRYPMRLPRLTTKQLTELTDAAHRRGLPVMVHVDNFDDMRNALTAGADTIEHTLNNATLGTRELPEDVLRMLTSRDVWVVPTMVATKHHDGSIPNAQPVFPALVKAVRAMRAAGVQLGVGCDSGIPFVSFGECEHEELELLCSAGMTPLEAITAATGKNAKLLRLEKELGRIASGCAADLLAVGGDPLTDIRATRDIRLVIRGGKIVEDRLLSAAE